MGCHGHLFMIKNLDSYSLDFKNKLLKSTKNQDIIHKI